MKKGCKGQVIMIDATLEIHEFEKEYIDFWRETQDQKIGQFQMLTVAFTVKGRNRSEMQGTQNIVVREAVGVVVVVVVAVVKTGLQLLPSEWQWLTA